MNNVSIIITALNEPYISETIFDILDKSGDYVSEIILIDDYSDKTININIPKVNVIRNSKRLGLIASRQLASSISSSDIVVCPFGSQLTTLYPR